MCTVIMAHIPPDRPLQTLGRYLREAQLAVVMVPGESGW